MAILRNLVETNNGFTHFESTYIAGKPAYVGDADYAVDDAEFEIKHDDLEGIPNWYAWVKSENPEKQSLVLSLAVYIPIKIGDFETKLHFQSGLGYEYDGIDEWDSLNRDNVTNTFYLVTNDALSRLYYCDVSDMKIKNYMADTFIDSLESIGLKLNDYHDVINLRNMLRYITPTMESLGIDLDINHYTFEVEENAIEAKDDDYEYIYKTWSEVLTTDVIWGICEPDDMGAD